MATPTTFQLGTGTRAKTRKGKRSHVGMFVVNGVAKTPYYKFGGVYCIAASVTGATLSPIEDEDVMAVGKTIVNTTEGTRWEGYTVTAHGNATGILRILGATGATSLGTKHEYQYPDQPLFGFEHSYQPGSNTVAVSRLIPYGIARVSELAGLEPDSSTTYDIELFNSDNTDYPIRSLKPGYMWAGEGWYDDAAAIINATAPNGVLTTFVLGTGNGSFVGTPTTPVAVIHDATLTGAAQYLFVFVNGVDVTSQVTFTVGTSTITFSTAPADGAKLNVIYAVAQGATVPGWDGGINPTQQAQIMYGWDDYGNNA